MLKNKGLVTSDEKESCLAAASQRFHFLFGITCTNESHNITRNKKVNRVNFVEYRNEFLVYVSE